MAKELGARWFTLVVLGDALIHFGVPWSSVWVPLADLGAWWVHLGVAWDPLGTPIVPFRFDLDFSLHLCNELVGPGGRPGSPTHARFGVKCL